MKNLIALCILMALVSCGPESKVEDKPGLQVVTDSAGKPEVKDSLSPDGTKTEDPAPADKPVVTGEKEGIQNDTANEYLHMGLMVYKNNVGTFIDCSSKHEYFINDLTTYLRAKYYSFDLPGNTPLYVEMVGKYMKPDDKTPKGMKRQFIVSHLNLMQKDVPYTCGAAINKLKEKK